MTTDFVGATTIPVPAPPAGQPVGDPLLYYCLQFFQAMANAYAPLAWNAVAPKLPDGTPLPVVYKVFAHDPKRYVFNARDLPALYMWRSDTKKRGQIGQDVRVMYGTCSLLWVLPDIGDQELRRQRGSFHKALFDLLDDRFQLGRDVAWKLVGDTYPNAQSVSDYGSVLPHFAGFRRMYFTDSKPVTLRIRADGADREYEAAEAILAFEEDLTRSSSMAFPNQPIPVTVTVNGLTVDSILT